MNIDELYELRDKTANTLRTFYTQSQNPVAAPMLNVNAMNAAFLAHQASVTQIQAHEARPPAMVAVAEHGTKVAQLQDILEGVVGDVRDLQADLAELRANVRALVRTDEGGAA